MAWIESSTSRDNSDAEKQLQEQKRLAEQAEQKEKSRPPESEQDARLKMGLWVLVWDFKWKMTGQATEWKTRLQTMKEKEWFLNSLSPENLWGYSWLVNGVKDSIQAWEMKFDTAKTNSALKTDIVEAYSELLNRRLIVLPKLEYMLQSWQRWEDIRNDASMRQFFITPEGEYILALARGENPKDTEATYTLAKARELKKYIPKGELYAQPLYEQLKGTKYESIANQEKMNIAETAWKKYISEVGNELLGTDSLAIMAISGPVWWALAKAVQWERAVAITQNSINAVNKSGIAKTLVPWVRVLGKEASDTVMMKLGKWTFNIAIDALKIGTYTETVRQLGWNDAAKYASYIFLFIPWAKMVFERDMLARPTSHVTSETILSWALAKIWPDRLKQFFQSQGAWIEANASQVATGAEQAVQEIQELAKTATINTGTTETGKQALEKWWEKVVEVVKKTREWIGQQVDISNSSTQKLMTGKVKQPDLPWTTPEEKMNALYQRAEWAKPRFDTILDDTAKRTWAVEVRKAPFKSRENALEKVNSEYRGKPEELKDIVRGTIAYEDIEWIRRGISWLQEHPQVIGYSLKDRLKNPWLRDILMNLKVSNIIVETQLHIRLALVAKADGLKLPVWAIPKWSFTDFNIMESLKKPREWIRTLAPDVNLPKEWELVKWHQLYEISRSLPWKEFRTPQEKEFAQKIQDLNLELDTQTIKLIEQETGKKFIP